MNKLMITLTACVGVAVAAPPPAARADSIAYYYPPKMKTRGTNQTPIGGAGKVIVKVLVGTDGSFKSGSILLSTNHADDAAALEIAKSSKYVPATRGSAKEVAYYDFTLRFNSSGAAVQSDTSPLAKYETMLRSGNYSGAQTGLKAYVATNPSDARGQLDLGIADTYSKNYQDAAAAFDKAGTIPAADRAVAGKAYIEYAVGLLGAKDYADGLTAAKHAATVAPGFAAQDTLGVAELQTGDAQSAVSDLEKAHDMAKSDKTISAASKVADDEHLIEAYLAAGNGDKAQAVAAEAKTLDPNSQAVVQALFAQDDATKAQAAGKSGDFATAATLYEQAAAAAPAQAGLLYTNAALAHLQVKPTPDSAQAEIDAQKALALNASDPAATYAEGMVQANTGKTDDAKKTLTHADELAKTAGNTSLSLAIEKALDQLQGANSKNKHDDKTQI